MGTLLLSSLALAQDKTQAMDPCGSPKEVYSKYMLDKCYKGYFDAIVESKKLAQDAAKKADEASRKVSGLEGRVSELEKRLNALSERPAPTPAPTPKGRRCRSLQVAT